MINDATLDTIAQNVRAARVDAGISLDVLAGRADVSKGALVALERARGNPNLQTLVRLADALGRPVSALMHDSREETVTVATIEQTPPVWTGPKGGSAHLLLTNPRPTPVEIWRWCLHPGERHESAAHPSGVTETLSVVRGEVQLVAGETTLALSAGSTATFAADVAHAYAGAGRGASEMIITVHLPATRPLPTKDRS